MILYGIDNIRDLFGHKVGHPSCCVSRLLAQLLMYCSPAYVLLSVSVTLQVSLSVVKQNPICRLNMQTTD